MDTTPENDLSEFEKAAPVDKPREEPPVDTSPPVSDEAKIAFLAHIIAGAPFIQQYHIAEAGYIEFSTIPSEALINIRRLARNDREQLHRLMSVASVRRIELGSTYISPVKGDWSSLDVYEAYVHDLPAGLVNIIESQYLVFSQTLSTLINKVSDRSFWQTP